MAGNVTFSATLNNAGAGTVQWVRSATSMGVGTVVTSPDAPPAVGTYYYRPQYLAGYGGCNLADGTETAVTVQVDPTWNVITSPATNICIGGSLTFSATLNNPGTGTVQWVRSATSMGVGTVVTSPDTPPAAGTYYYRPQYIPGYGGCNLADGTETAVTVQVDPTWNVITSPATNICVGGSVTFSATLNNAGTGTVQWIRSATSLGVGTVVTSPDAPPAVGTYYYRPQYVAGYGGCNLADGTETLVTVQVDPTWNVITSPAANICVGGSVTFSATLNNAGTGTVQWVRSATSMGVGTVVTSPDAPGVGTYYYRPQYVAGYGGCNLADGTETLVTVQVDPTWNVITTPAANICVGGSVTFSATLNNAGTGTVQWVRSATSMGGGTVVTSPDAPGVGTYYYRPQYVAGYGGCNLADGTETLVTVQVDPTWNVITTPAANICVGGSVTFSATLNNAGTGTVQWIRSATSMGVGTVVTSPDSPGVGTYYYRPQYVAGYGGCNLADGTETLVTVQVDPTWNVITTPAANICAGGSVTFSATLNNAGTGTVQWVRSATSMGGGTVVTSPDAPGVGTYYYRPQYVGGYGGCNLADGTETLVTVQVDPTWNVITTPAANICVGGSVTFSATLNNAGTGTVQWVRSATSMGGGTVVTSPDAPGVGTYYYRPQYVAGYGGCNLADGTETLVTVQVDPTWNVITTPAANICVGGSVTFSATLNNAGTGTVQWVRSATSMGVGTVVTSPDSPGVGTYYYRPQYVAGYGGCNLADGTETLVTVQVDPTWNVITTPAANICVGGSVTFSATLNNAGTGTVQWVRSATSMGGGTVVISPDAPGVGTYYYRPQYVAGYGGCNLSDGTETLVTVQVDPTWNVITAPASNICVGGSVSFSATLNNAGTGTVQWVRSATSMGGGTVVTSPDSPGVGTYYYRPQYVAGYGGCNLADGTETLVHVYPYPVLTSTATPDPLCNGVVFSYTPTSDVGGTSFMWNRATIAGITPVGPTSGTDSPNELLTNTTTSPISVRYVYTLTANGCTNPTTFNVDVLVNPTSVINSAATANWCNNVSNTYTATSTSSTATFAWTRAVVAGISNLAGSGSTAVITETLNNTTTEPVIVHYLITPSVNGCAGTTFDLAVTVNPTAVITSAATANWCNNVSNTYTATSSSSTATFAWTRAVVAGISNLAGSGSTAVITETLINTTTEPVIVHYLITPSVNGCAGTTFDLAVTVNPTAVITSAATANWCNNVSNTYTATSSSSTATFAWTRAVVAGISNLAGSGSTAVITETLINTTTEPVIVHYLITPSVNGCAGTTFDLAVTVNPTAVITSAATANWCNNVSNTYTATSSSSTAAFAWTRAVVAGISNLAGSGSTAVITETLINTTTEPVIVHYLITPGVNGCAGTTFDLAVTVNPTAVITSAATANWCNNVSNTYTAMSSSSTATFAWTRAVVAGISNLAGSGSTAVITETLINTTTEPVIVHYLITPSRQWMCRYTLFDLAVTVNPTAVIASAAAANWCNNIPNTYTATSSSTTATFAWTRAVVAGISNLAGSGSTAAITETLINTTTEPVVVHYLITRASMDVQDTI